jgi:hypothetical protein
MAKVVQKTRSNEPLNNLFYDLHSEKYIHLGSKVKFRDL